MRTTRARAGALASALIFVAGSLVAAFGSQASAEPSADAAADGVTVVTTPTRRVYGPTDLGHVTWTGPEGMALSSRSLLPDEIVARGLNRTAPQAELRVVPPRLIDARTTKSLEKPTRKPPTANSPIGVLACWSHSWQQGWSGGGGLWGRTDVTWCSDGTWLTNTWANCYGIDGGYPSYEFLSCQISETYGVGWSAWDVKTVVQLCDAWIPLWGSCGHNRTYWAKFRFGAQGQMVLLDWHNG